MPVFDLFHKRQQKARGETLNVYRYDEIPDALRVQVFHIWEEAFGHSYPPSEFSHPCPVRRAFAEIEQSLCKELGVLSLNDSRERRSIDRVANFMFETKDAEVALSVIELSFAYLNATAGNNQYQYPDAKVRPPAAISEVNLRFQEHGIGYTFDAGSNRIIRIDSQFIHAEAVKPVLALLSDKRYSGVNDEFLKAHEHYRAGRDPEAIVECLKAFESTLKTIFDKRRWPHKQNDTAKPLLDICFAHKLIPDYLQSEFSALRSVLEAGVPTVRNRTSGHGQGVTPVTVPKHLASYALHLTASSILFLVECDKQLN
jgi:hypothetical protein